MLDEALIIHLLSSQDDLHVFPVASIRASSTPLRRVITVASHSGRPDGVFSGSLGGTVVALAGAELEWPLAGGERDAPGPTHFDPRRMDGDGGSGLRE